LGSPRISFSGWRHSTAENETDTLLFLLYKVSGYTMLEPIACPGAGDFQRLQLGQMSQEDADRLARHLESCNHCAATVQGLKIDDTLIEALRALAGTASPAPDPIVADLIQRLKAAPSVAALQATLAPWPPPPIGGLAGPPAAGEACDFLAPPQSAEELGWLGSYRVLKVLGTGGMGLVFQAKIPASSATLPSRC
jgi:hypothetical protein